MSNSNNLKNRKKNNWAPNTDFSTYMISFHILAGWWLPFFFLTLCSSPTHTSSVPKSWFQRGSDVSRRLTFSAQFPSMLGRNHKLYSIILPQKKNQNTLAPRVHLLCQWFTSSVILYSLSRKEIQNIWDNFNFSSGVSWVIHLFINVGGRGLLSFFESYLAFYPCSLNLTYKSQAICSVRKLCFTSIRTISPITTLLEKNYCNYLNIKIQVRIVCFLGVYPGMIGLKVEAYIQYHYTVHQLLE